MCFNGVAFRGGDPLVVDGVPGPVLTCGYNVGETVPFVSPPPGGPRDALGCAKSDGDGTVIV